jgi:hypothetical protein
MLLSFYLLYRYARSAKPKSYILEITLFIIVISLFSTDFPVTQFFILTFPFNFLSWPTYSWYLELPAPESLIQYDIYRFNFIPYRGISFLTLDVTSTPSWEYRDGSLISNNLWSLEQSVNTFSFFLLVNILGAFLGYWIGKNHELPHFSDKWWIVVGAAVIACMGLPFIFGFLLGVKASIALFAVGTILLETILLTMLIEVFARYRVATLMVLAGTILLLTSYPINHNQMTIGGWAFVLLGIAIYYLEFVIARARARQTEQIESNNLK